MKKMTAEILVDGDCSWCDLRSPHRHFISEDGKLENRVEPWEPKEMSVEEFLKGVR